MKKLIAATLVAFVLSTPAMAFDISTIDGIPGEMKDMIARQSGGRVTNKQANQQGGQLTGQQDQQQQQAGEAGQQQQQGGRQARKKQSAQDKAVQSVDQIMKGDSTVGQAIGSFR